VGSTLCGREFIRESVTGSGNAVASGRNPEKVPAYEPWAVAENLT